MYKFLCKIRRYKGLIACVNEGIRNATSKDS